MKENFSSKLCSLSLVPINIEDDKVSLKWPSDSGWNITSDSEPCEVCVCVYTLHGMGGCLDKRCCYPHSMNTS